MWPRRNFLKFGAAATATAVAAPWALAGVTASVAPQGTPHFVLVDGSFQPSVRFGHGFGAGHRIDRDALLTQWSQLQSLMGTHGTISGLTRPTDLPIVLQLVAAHGARVVYREAAGNDRVAALIQHMVNGVAPVACTQAGPLPALCTGPLADHGAAHTGPETWLGWSVQFGAA